MEELLYNKVAAPSTCYSHVIQVVE